MRQLIISIRRKSVMGITGPSEAKPGFFLFILVLSTSIYHVNSQLTEEVVKETCHKKQIKDVKVCYDRRATQYCIGLTR